MLSDTRCIFISSKAPDEPFSAPNFFRSGINSGIDIGNACANKRPVNRRNEDGAGNSDSFICRILKRHGIKFVVNTHLFPHFA